MVRLNDFIKLPVDERIVREALNNSVANTDVGLNNLRYRPRNLILDCKVRGYIGELSLRKWFAQYDIFFNESNFYDDVTNMDIDLLYTSGHNAYSYEVKTSLVPDFYRNMTGVIQRADIKIIKRTNNIEDVSGDVHIQIYFDFLRKERDNELRNLPQNINDINHLYDLMNLNEYIDNTYFVAWIDKPTLIRYVNSIHYKTWSFPNSQRFFWKCPIGNVAKKPIEIIEYTHRL